MLRTPTDPRWLGVALADLDRVLVDHAHCEKKAAAQALALVSAWPRHERLVRALTSLAREELRHFQQVHRRLRARGLSLGRDPGDPYARALQSRCRHGPEADRLLDRLLVGALIEARSCERLTLLGGALPERGLGGLAGFYRELARSESAHAHLFVDLARAYTPQDRVASRLEALAAEEARILAELPLAPRLH